MHWGKGKKDARECSAGVSAWSGRVTGRPAFPYQRVFLAYFANVYLPQDVILCLLAFLSEGLPLLEALPPEENLGAGETAEEWREVVIYPVETIRKRYAPSTVRQPSTPPPPSSASQCTHSTAAGWEAAWISLWRVSNPDCMYFHCRLNKAQLPACQPLASQTRTIST